MATGPGGRQRDLGAHPPGAHSYALRAGAFRRVGAAAHRSRLCHDPGPDPRWPGPPRASAPRPGGRSSVPECHTFGVPVLRSLRPWRARADLRGLHLRFGPGVRLPCRPPVVSSPHGGGHVDLVPRNIRPHDASPGARALRADCSGGVLASVPGRRPAPGSIARAGRSAAAASATAATPTA